MERLSVDFKGPLKSRSQNSYLFTAVDEYSRFPFAIPCKDMSSATVKLCLDTIFSFCGMPSFVHSDRGTSFLSRDVRDHLTRRGVACSATTPYHPEGNSQCERYNGIIWKAVQLAIKDRKLTEVFWEEVLPDALHSIRSLLTTTTNATPHERFFNFSRRSGLGSSLPTWLLTPGPVLLRRFVRHSKNDPFVDEVELIAANPTYARIRYPSGRESSVSLRDLAPCPSRNEAGSVEQTPKIEPVDIDEASPATTPIDGPSETSDTEPRRSCRHRQQPDRYGFPSQEDSPEEPQL